MWVGDCEGVVCCVFGVLLVLLIEMLSGVRPTSNKKVFMICRYVVGLPLDASSAYDWAILNLISHSCSWNWFCVALHEVLFAGCCCCCCC